MHLVDESAHDPAWDALVVAGGRARRLGGIDKTALLHGGRSLLDGVLSATIGARRVCVIGSDARLPVSILRTVERPRWAGPAAAIVAGLETLSADSTDAAEDAADWIVVLAADLVRADDAVAVLLTRLEQLRTDRAARDGLIAVDSEGRRQPLLAVYRRRALNAAVAAFGPADNLSVMGLVRPLDLVELSLPDELGDDVDTPADAARLGITLPPRHRGHGSSAQQTTALGARDDTDDARPRYWLALIQASPPPTPHKEPTMPRISTGHSISPRASRPVCGAC